MTPQVKSVIEELLCGKLVLLVDHLGHGKLISLVEHITSSHINFMITQGRGMIYVGIEKSRAVDLGFKLQHSASTENLIPSFTFSVNVDGTTGTSAITKPKRKSKSFKKTVDILPVIAHHNGISGKQSHVEAGIELAKLCNSYPSVVMSDVLNEKGEFANHHELVGISEKFKLKIFNIEDLIQYFFNSQLSIKTEKQTKVENRVGEFELLAYSYKMDSFYDYIFFTEKLHTAGVTPVYNHKNNAPF